MVSDRIGCWWIVASYLVAQSLHPSHSITPFPLPPPKLLLFALQIIHYTSHFPFVYMKIYSNPSNSHSHYFLLGGNGRNKQNLHFPGAAQCPLLLSLTFLILPIFIFRSLTKQALLAKSSIPQYTAVYWIRSVFIFWCETAFNLFPLTTYPRCGQHMTRLYI